MLTNFAIPRSYLEFGLAMKFDVWSRLPWRLAALAHHDARVRASAARDCMQIYDKSISDGYTDAMHHAMTVRFMSPMYVLREHIEGMAQGGVISDALKVAVARLKFIPVAERTLGIIP